MESLLLPSSFRLVTLRFHSVPPFSTLFNLRLRKCTSYIFTKFHIHSFLTFKQANNRGNPIN